MKANTLFYWGSTILLCLIFLLSASMYLMSYEMVQGFFVELGFPIWLIYPLAALKILGVIAIVTKRSYFLKELAYAGFLFDATLATAAHYMAGHGVPMLSLLALLATVVSWRSDHELYPR